jgi:hypothetical protein
VVLAHDLRYQQAPIDPSEMRQQIITRENVFEYVILFIAIMESRNMESVSR